MSTRITLGKLTTLQIAAFKPGARKRDISDPAVPGLLLCVGVSGNKYWLFRFKWKGKSSRISLGAFPSVGPAEARQLTFKNHDLIEQGIDPRRAKRTGRRDHPRVATNARALT